MQHTAFDWTNILSGSKVDAIQKNRTQPNNLMPYCKYCGAKAPTISSLTSSLCLRHPNGPNKGKHILYEGSEKSRYECKYCGAGASTISSLASSLCPRHPSGANKGKHEPALYPDKDELKYGRTIGSQSDLLKGMEHSQKHLCWLTKVGFKDRYQAINDFIPRIKLIERP